MKIRKERVEEFPPAPAPRHTAPTPPVGTPMDSPPLFIKLDKYREIVKEIQRLKSYSLGLRDALDALADVEAELKNGLSVAQKALDHFNSIVSLLDAKFLRLQGLGDTDIDEIPEDVDKYVQGLYEQMEKIKSDIKTISSPIEDDY